MFEHWPLWGNYPNKCTFLTKFSRAFVQSTVIKHLHSQSSILNCWPIILKIITSIAQSSPRFMFLMDLSTNLFFLRGHNYFIVIVCLNCMKWPYTVTSHGDWDNVKLNYMLLAKLDFLWQRYGEYIFFPFRNFDINKLVDRSVKSIYWAVICILIS